MKYRTPMDYFELVEMFPRPGCAVCNLLRRDIERAIDGLVYGFMDTEEMRVAFRAGRGLCSEHGWMLKQNKFGNVLGVAKLYGAALDEVIQIIEQTPLPEARQSTLERFLGNGQRPLDSTPLANQLEPTGPCLICARADEREADYMQIFSQYVTDERFRTTFEASDGLCLPHFRRVLRQMRNPDHLDTLITIQRDIWVRLKAEVEQFVAKQNYEHLDELTGSEGDSWARAIARMGGETGVFGLRRKGN